MQRMMSNKWVILSLVLPGVAVFTFSVFFPIPLSLYYSVMKFTNFASSSMQFVGLQNYKTLLFDPVIWQSLLRAFWLGLALILLQHPAALVVAIMLDNVGGRREKFFRSAYFVPAVLSATVICSLWNSMLEPTYGLLNNALGVLGLGSLKQPWLANPHTAFPAIIVICMWQGFGWAVLLYYAGVKGIPDEFIEAAKIDGANWFDLVARIIIPLLWPIIIINFTLAMISAFKQMEIVFLTTGGGPGNVTNFIANYLYNQAFKSNKYGYGMAISVFFVAVCMLVTWLLNRLSTNKSYEY